MRRAVVKSWGSYLPPCVVTNEELAKKVDTSDEWIVQRTGIRSRHIAAEGEKTSDLAIAAARQALERANLSGNDLDLIILATTTPDNTFPATATKVQAALGMTCGAAFDIQAVCSGFIYALSTANAYIQSGLANRILVIGAETFSRILDWNDRTTCVLFGDGAGALLLEAQEQPGTGTDRGVLSTHIHSDGQYYDLLHVDGGPSSSKQVGVVKMNGKDVFRHAVARLAEAIDEALSANNLTISDIDWLVPHQANSRIIEGAAQKMDLPMERVVLTLDHHGNTSAASIPLALAETADSGRIKPGQTLLIDAMGGGFTWGSALLRW